MLLLNKMVVLFLLMALGFYLYKKAVITEEISKKLSYIVVNVANPALTLTGCMSEEKIAGRELLVTAALAVLTYVVLVLLAQILPTVLRIPSKSQGTYKAMTIFSNIGFMGFPVVSALYGKGALLYAALFCIPYNILIYTYGVSVMAAAPKEGAGEKKGFSFQRVFNIGVIACIVAIVIYLLDVPVPAMLGDTLTYLSNLTAPLSMMVIGASLATIDLKGLFMDGKLLLFSGIKLLLLPVLGVLLIKQFISNEVLVGVCMVMLATPVGSMTAMLAQQYEGDYEMASRGVALTTVLSVLTIPLVSVIVGV